MNITEPWIKPNERLEAEKPAEDARELAYKIRETKENDGIIVWPESVMTIEESAQMIKSFAQQYHAKECAKCMDNIKNRSCRNCALDGEQMVYKSNCRGCYSSDDVIRKNWQPLPDAPQSSESEAESRR